MANESTLRVLVVANKNWECEPMVGVLAGKRPRPRSLELVGTPHFPAYVADSKVAAWQQSDGTPRTNSATAPAPRLRLTSSASTYTKQVRDDDLERFLKTGWRMEVEVWCIQDWMTHEVIVSSSSSRDKWVRALPTIRDAAFSGHAERPIAPDLVIAMGTAGMPSDEIVNGCVSLGSRVYVSDPFQDNPSRREARKTEGRRLDAMLDLTALPLPPVGALTDLVQSRGGALSSGALRSIPDEVRYAAEACFLAAPVHAARPPRIFSGNGFAALSTINVTDYDDYVWTDPRTRKRFLENVELHEIGSMESTHGLIHAAWPNSGFLYVSGLTDRIPLFNQEVSPRPYSQNFACAHNAGVTIAFLLPALFDLHRAGKLMAKPS